MPFEASTELPVDVSVIRVSMLKGGAYKVYRNCETEELCDGGAEESFFRQEGLDAASRVFYAGYPPVSQTPRPIPFLRAAHVSRIGTIPGQSFNVGDRRLRVVDERLFYVDSASRRGYSGGPVLNESNQIIGLMTGQIGQQDLAIVTPSSRIVETLSVAVDLQQSADEPVAGGNWSNRPPSCSQ